MTYKIKSNLLDKLIADPLTVDHTKAEPFCWANQARNLYKAPVTESYTRWLDSCASGFCLFLPMP